MIGGFEAQRGRRAIAQQMRVDRRTEQPLGDPDDPAIEEGARQFGPLLMEPELAGLCGTGEHRADFSEIPLEERR